MDRYSCVFDLLPGCDIELECVYSISGDTCINALLFGLLESSKIDVRKGQVAVELAKSNCHHSTDSTTSASQEDVVTCEGLLPEPAVLLQEDIERSEDPEREDPDLGTFLP